MPDTYWASSPSACWHYSEDDPVENRPGPDRRAPDGDGSPHSGGPVETPITWGQERTPPAWTQERPRPFPPAPQPPAPTATHAPPGHHPPGPYGYAHPLGGPPAPPTNAWPPGPVPPPPVQDRRHGASVLFGALTAATVALVALAASVLMVISTPREEPSPDGMDLSQYYDDSLRARPSPVEITLETHPLYEISMPTEVECDLPELNARSEDSWLDFATASGHCLDDLWAPVMEELGLYPEPLEYAVTTEPPEYFEDDEEGYILAYYEGERTRITVVLSSVQEIDQYVPESHRQNVWLALMGHEYGHHVQHATGLLEASYDLLHEAGNEEDELETTRRTELQAECLAGTALRGVTGGDTTALNAVNEYLNGGGDLSTHGRALNRAYWLEQGWHQGVVGGCNTYEADQRRVT